MPVYIWKPIEPLTHEDEATDLASIQPLYESWRAYKERLRTSSQEKLHQFNARLVRRLSIETGILEHLYDLDRGTTEALVAHGFMEDLISKSDPNMDPANIIDFLRDQEAAIHLVMDCVANNRPLTKGLIHELHAILTRHQDTTDAKDQFGTRIKIKLRKGAYKLQPNNPRKTEGDIHEYCPPIHVDGEMDNLLKWFSDYGEKDPIVVSAWLHHRFTQIHPYQDGNGRLSRTLVTLVLLKAGLLPLVIDRDLRASYILDLEAADFGDLSKLTQVFARLERDAILQALSIDVDEKIAEDARLSSAAISSLSDRLARRREKRFAELRRVNILAVELREAATEQLSHAVEELKDSLQDLPAVQTFVENGGADFGTGYYYKFEVASSAKKTGHFANFTEDHYFTKTSVKLNEDRLVFVISLHHAGRELSGVMEAIAFAKLETDLDEDTRSSVGFVICAKDPFVFTHTTKLGDISEAFERWVDAAFAIALAEFGDRL